MHFVAKLFAVSVCLLSLAGAGTVVAQNAQPVQTTTQPGEKPAQAPAVPAEGGAQPAQNTQPAADGKAQPAANVQQPAAGAAQPAQNAATPAQPTDAAVAAEAGQSQTAEQLAHAGKELARLRDLIAKASDDDIALAELKVQVDAVAKQIISTSIATRPRLDEIKARLTELGDPPGAGQPPEADIVTAERKRLLAERGEINALTGRPRAFRSRRRNCRTASRRRDARCFPTRC